MRGCEPSRCANFITCTPSILRHSPGEQRRQQPGGHKENKRHARTNNEEVANTHALGQQRGTQDWYTRDEQGGARTEGLQSFTFSVIHPSWRTFSKTRTNLYCEKRWVLESSSNQCFGCSSKCLMWLCRHSPGAAIRLYLTHGREPSVVEETKPIIVPASSTNWARKFTLLISPQKAQQKALSEDQIVTPQPKGQSEERTQSSLVSRRIKEKK